METYFHGRSKEEIVKLLPDTIYLPKKEIIERLPWIAEPYKDDPFWDEVYIRKDALLKWAKEKLERLYELIPDAHKVEDETATPMEMRYLGQYMQMESVIDKINKM